MSILLTALVLAPPALFLYAYIIYPAVLWFAAGTFRRPTARVEGGDWPTVTLTLPVYNEARNIRQKLNEVLALDYPSEKLQILVISDASTDGTDEIVAEYDARGVELLRLTTRRGKTAAENAAGRVARGSIIVNNDATVRIPPHALKKLVRAFDDPTIGVASGRDISVGRDEREPNRGESKYVGYEMWLRGLETRIGSIVGASGCFYGIRVGIYDSSFPDELSRDFASALMARSHDLRAVSVHEAICYVPRAGALTSEFRRKVRTMARGLETLWRYRRLLNPLEYGAFALMLMSHKLCRWLVYLFIPLSFTGLAILGFTSRLAAITFLVATLSATAGGLAWHRTQSAARVSGIIAFVGFAFASVVAGIIAWSKLLRRQHSPFWEPTRRVSSAEPTIGSRS